MRVRFRPACITLALCFATFSHAQDSCSSCDDVHFFLARGNNEPYPGRQGALVAATCDGLSKCGYEDLIYSALYTDLYCQTAFDGNIAGHMQITAYAEMCPDAKLILAGYSQGGQIMTDLLGGGGGVLFNGCVQPDTPAFDPNTSPGDRISAVIVFGDVRHVANQSYNYGSGSAIPGYFPRNETMLDALDAYADIMCNWCADTDPICAAGATSEGDATHLDYYDLYSDDAASWIKPVASLTETSSFTTAIPTSVSGTVQDYAAVGTATPSGSVILDTTWTNMPTSVSCTPTSTMASSNSTISEGSSSTSAASPSSSVTGTPGVRYPLGVVSSSSVVVVATTSSTTSSSSPSTSTSDSKHHEVRISAGLFGTLLSIAAWGI